jgi:UDP-N-acetyl-D-mannosaminuronate dehydrogenase
LRIIEVLRSRGAIVSYHDAYVPELREFDLRSVDLDAALQRADAVVVVTAHPGIDYGAALERSAVLVDLRGVTRHIEAAARRPQMATAAEADEQLVDAGRLDDRRLRQVATKSRDVAAS